MASRPLRKLRELAELEKQAMRLNSNFCDATPSRYREGDPGFSPDDPLCEAWTVAFEATLVPVFRILDLANHYRAKLGLRANTSDDLFAAYRAAADATAGRETAPETENESERTRADQEAPNQSSTPQAR